MALTLEQQKALAIAEAELALEQEMSLGDKATNVAGAIVEPILHLGSAGVAQAAGGLGALGAAGNRALGFDTGHPVDVQNKIIEAMTYQPRTQGGKAETDFVTKPFQWLGEKAKGLGDSSEEIMTPYLGETGGKLYGGLTEAMVGLSPALVGAPKGTRFNPDYVAGKMLKETSGPRIKAIRDALMKADKDLTAGQAIVPARSTETAALFKSGEARKPTPYNLIKDAQQESRVGRLQDIAKPEVRKYMENIRGGVAEKLYDAGRKGSLQKSGVSKVVSEIDKVIESKPGFPEFTNKLKEIRKGLVDENGNIRTNAEQVMSSVEGITSMLKNKEFGHVEGQIHGLKKSIVDLSDKYKQGDQFYAQTSRPINQMNIAQELTDSISPRMGSTERASAYANALANQKLLMKKANKGKRPVSGELETAVTPEQMKTFNSIGDELTRNVDYNKQASVGMAKMQEITGDLTTTPKAGLLERAVVIYNAVMKRLEGRVSDAALDRISDLGKPENRKYLLEILEKATPEEKAALMEVYKIQKKTGKGTVMVGAEQEKNND